MIRVICWLLMLPVHLVLEATKLAFAPWYVSIMTWVPHRGSNRGFWWVPIAMVQQAIITVLIVVLLAATAFDKTVSDGETKGSVGAAVFWIACYVFGRLTEWHKRTYPA